uniref:DNA-dependent metalloprotease SPRTN n=1 Tax=Neogobius melanostomus TaxID=47308 RepID=A0A8C6ULP1_9GOBI
FSWDVVPSWKPNPQPERPLSIVDESWETLDPNPDVRSMFLEFNDLFFWGKLSVVEVKWSPRMTLCAGVCSYEGRGGLCSIRLSEPLLKLRPRKDLVETLLHEMIHALLFVTQNNRDRDGHGPEFCKHMNRINEASGTNISIYHSFHDEVDVYRQHWWRCNGPCQSRKPYFGYVKRAMNRAPSHLDPWWEDHRRTCGGTYTKVKEPEGYGKKKSGKKDKAAPSMSTSGNEKTESSKNLIPFSGKGFTLGGKSQTSTSSSPSVPSPASSSSPQKPLSSLAKFPTFSPIRSGLETKAASSAFPSAKPLNKPIKRSVSNTKVFVNINGSPVKISAPKSISGGSDGAEKSKYFNETNTNRVPNGGQGSRKRSWEDSRSSASIFDYFQKTLGGSSKDSESASSSAVKLKSATATTSASSAPHVSVGQTNTASSSSSSSAGMMVSCPVCQMKVQEAKINEHLDSCLAFLHCFIFLLQPTQVKSVVAI